MAAYVNEGPLRSKGQWVPAIVFHLQTHRCSLCHDEPHGKTSGSSVSVGYTKAYAEGWDNIFGPKKPRYEPSVN